MIDNVTRWNDMTRTLVRSNPSELRLMDLENTLRMTDRLALTREWIHFNTWQGRRWTNDVFQTNIEEMEPELRTTDSLARTSLTGGDGVRGNVRSHSLVIFGSWQRKHVQAQTWEKD